MFEVLNEKKGQPMSRIVANIFSLEQHLWTLQHDPEAYRPDCCPHCGLAGKKLKCHGCYKRKPDRGPDGDGRLNPIPIPRYRCRPGLGCGRTCSRLPMCVPARRWYRWAVQQVALLLLMAGRSCSQVSRRMGMHHSTVGRWGNWLKQRGHECWLGLRARCAEYGRAVDALAFWEDYLLGQLLSCAMAWLDHDGVEVP